MGKIPSAVKIGALSLLILASTVAPNHFINAKPKAEYAMQEKQGVKKKKAQKSKAHKNAPTARTDDWQQFLNWSGETVAECAKQKLTGRGVENPGDYLVAFEMAHSGGQPAVRWGYPIRIEAGLALADTADADRHLGKFNSGTHGIFVIGYKVPKVQAYLLAREAKLVVAFEIDAGKPNAKAACRVYRAGEFFSETGKRAETNFTNAELAAW